MQTKLATQEVSSIEHNSGFVWYKTNDGIDPAVVDTTVSPIPSDTRMVLEVCASGGCASGGCASGGCASGGCASGGCASGGCASGGCDGAHLFVVQLDRLPHQLQRLSELLQRRRPHLRLPVTVGDRLAELLQTPTKRTTYAPRPTRRLSLQTDAPRREPN